jgi:hypothetical protein
VYKNLRSYCAGLFEDLLGFLCPGIAAFAFGTICLMIGIMATDACNLSNYRPGVYASAVVATGLGGLIGLRVRSRLAQALILLCAVVLFFLICGIPGIPVYHW